MTYAIICRPNRLHLKEIVIALGLAVASWNAVFPDAAVAASGKASSPAKPTAAASKMAAALPAHFAIGVESSPNELNQGNTFGEYTYQYLNLGWQYWSSQFASSYVQQAQNLGMVTVFTWYELGSTGLWGWDRINYMSQSWSMYSYYSDFVQLLQQIAAVAQPYPGVVVHIEPDLWGFMQQSYGDNPSVIPVAVASSGFPGLGWLPDNAAGFAQALIQLRNTYAPNVMLAWHASDWGPSNGYDPTLSYPAYYQTPQITGARVATFYLGLGASFDMIFHDPSDASSAYKVIIRGQSASTAWWSDAAFSSYLQYIQAIYQQTGLPSMLWQIPCGNTLYDTDNNSSYHYQDNRPQYFLSSGNVGNIWNFAAQGVIGLLFGPAQSTDTDFRDYSGDGVFNPAPIDGNTLWSSMPDDDGGFLQTATAAYYSGGPVPLASEARRIELSGTSH